MPEKATIERAKQDKREGKRPTTQAGEFVREEIHHIREGKHGARSTKQAIAIGLSKARRAGVPLKPPAKGRVSEKTRKSAKAAYEKGQRHEPISEKRYEARIHIDSFHAGSFSPNESSCKAKRSCCTNSSSEKSISHSRPQTLVT